MSPHYSDGSDLMSDHDAYRLVAIRSQDYRRALDHATRTLGLSALVSYALHLCEYFIACGPELGLRRVMRTVLGVALASLASSREVPRGQQRARNYVELLHGLSLLVTG